MKPLAPPSLYIQVGLTLGLGYVLVLGQNLVTSLSIIVAVAFSWLAYFYERRCTMLLNEKIDYRDTMAHCNEQLSAILADIFWLNEQGKQLNDVMPNLGKLIDERAEASEQAEKNLENPTRE